MRTVAFETFDGTTQSWKIFVTLVGGMTDMLESPATKVRTNHECHRNKALTQLFLERRANTLNIHNLMAYSQPGKDGLREKALKEEGEYLDIQRVKAYHVE